MEKESQIVSNYCTRCSGHTKHKIVAIKEIGSSSADDFGWIEKYCVIECRGCERVSFRLDYQDEGMVHHVDDGMVERYWETKLFPPILENHIELKDTYDLPHHIRIAYTESVNAFKANCPLLTAAGFRATIEAVCNDKGVKGKDIVTKIENLNVKGYLSKREADRLHAVRFLGNDSIHEINVPNDKQLLSALSIIDHLLNSLYLIDAQIATTIETVIRDYEEFEYLLSKKIKKLSPGDEVSLRDIFDKSLRRIKGDLKHFEESLQINIRKKKYLKLALGKLVKEKVRDMELNIQYYIKL